LRKLLSISIFCILLEVAALAQQVDAAFGLSAVSGPSASSASGNFSPQSIGGGVFPTISGDFLFLHHFGVQGEVSWRATRSLYAGFQPFRPLFYDFNAIWAPPVGKYVTPEIMGGIGAESIRFYTSTISCSFTSCTNFVSSNHFLGHVGGGLRLYPHGHFFIRPEAHLYFVRNNFEFSGARVLRYGASLGYSFGGY
jgi:hypothetical protein